MNRPHNKFSRRSIIYHWWLPQLHRDLYVGKQPHHHPVRSISEYSGKLWDGKGIFIASAMKLSPIVPHNLPPLQQLLMGVNKVNCRGRIDSKTSALNKTSFAQRHIISGCGRVFSCRDGAALRVSVLDQQEIVSPMNTDDCSHHSVVTVGEARC